MVAVPSAAPVQESAKDSAQAGAKAAKPTDMSKDLDPEATIEELSNRIQQLEKAEEARRTHAFVKGWLTNPGDVDFYSDKHRFVVGLQFFPVETQLSETRVNRTYYLAAVPRVSLHFGRLYMGFEMPFAFEAFDTVVDSADPDFVDGRGFTGAGSFAGLEWDEPSEYAQIIRYFRIGTKEDKLYLNVSKLSAATVGHGTMLRRYNPNIDLNHAHVSAQVDKGFKYGGVEFYSNDIVNYGITGGLAYVKPGGFFFPDNLFARSASIGFSYMADRNAPYTLVRPEAGSELMVADDKNAPQVDESRVATVLGIDAEVKVVRKDRFDVKTYLDYSRLANTGGDGVSVGTLVRFNVGGDKDDQRVHAFRLRAEGGAYHAQYVPGYFDMFYEIEKYQTAVGSDNARMTKLVSLENQTGGYRLGGRVEASYAAVGGLGLSAAYQGSMGGRDSQVLLHAELPKGEHLRLLATYVRNNPFDGAPLFTLENPNALLIAKAKVRVLPFMFINGEVSQVYRLQSASSEGARETTAYPSGSDLEAGDSAVFQNVPRWVLETEIGFEF